MKRSEFTSMTGVMDVLSDIARVGGTQALEFFDDLKSREVESKSRGDFVSDADRAVEQELRRLLQAEFPRDTILGEEMGGRATRRYWIVDPIDGTSNFLSGLPFWSVSIGYVEDGAPTVGAVIAPSLGVLVVGAIGCGSHISGLAATSAPASPPPCFGVGRNSRWDSRNRCQIEDRIENLGLNVINVGSCALSLMFVACGRLHGYVEKRVAGLWDCAGGVAICRANGIPARLVEQPDGSFDVFAGRLEIDELIS